MDKFCDICGAVIINEYIDGRTRMGPWANMCRSCFDIYGVGLGTGFGQRYVRNKNNMFIKIEG